MYTQKNNDRITVPIIENAQKIIDKYSWYHSKNGTIFPVASNQKLNDYLKEAAELAALDREIVETYFIGTQRYEEIHKFYETISCHAGRRTSVCCSLALQNMGSEEIYGMHRGKESTGFLSFSH